MTQRKKTERERAKTGIRIGFKAKILGLSLPITIVMVVILIAIAYNVFRTDIIGASEDLLRTSAKDQAHQIESWLNQKLKEASTVKYDIEHSNAMTDDEELQQTLNSYYALDSDFSGGFYVCDQNGAVIRAEQNTNSFSSPTSQIWFQEGITRVNPGFTQAAVNAEGTQMISVCGMLNDLDRVRVFSANLTLDSISIIVNSSVSMKKAQSLLIDKLSGTILVARDHDLISSNVNTADTPFLKRVAEKLAIEDYSLDTIDGEVSVMKEIGGTDLVLVSYISLSEITAEVDSLRTELIVVAAVCILILAVLSFISVHIAVNPLKHLTKRIREMSDGDFTIMVEPKGHDEIADIQRSVRGFIASMRQMIQEITEVSQKIKEQADNSSMVSESMLAASKAQADSMGALNNTVDQFSVSIMEVAQGATELSGVVSDTTADSDVVKEKIDGTVTISKKGRADMQRVDEAMDDIRASMDVLVKAINEVGRASKEITGIVGFIGEISDETSLLALNASIEAARAGEAGRGFAVVASQISKLADTTAGSVENISSLIKDVDRLVDAAVEQADVSVDNINESSERIRVAVRTFDDIYERILNVNEVIGKMVGEVQAVNGVATDVSAISEEQAASTEMIHDTSKQMVEQANALAKESAQVAEGAKILIQTSEELTKHMKRFQV